MSAIHRLQDRLQQTLALSQRRSHKTHSERAASLSKRNGAYAAMEAITEARDWQEEAKRLYDQQIAEAAEAEEIYNDSVKRTPEKTEALEKHVKTMTMRADSLAATEADFFQCQSSTTQKRPRAQCPCAAELLLLISYLSSVCLSAV